jgi:signal transduction histidine kinase
MEYFYCLDSVPNLFGLFDTTIAPSLLYYSYIPIVIISLVFGFLVYNKNTKHLLSNKLFFAIVVSFSLFIMNEIVQWIAVPTSLVHFGWELAPLLQILTLISSIYFVLVFINQHDEKFFQKILLFMFTLPVLVLLPTTFNMESFDLINCESQIGPLFTYVYTLEILSIFFVLFICLRKYFKTDDKILRRQILFITLGTSAFIVMLSASNIFGEIFNMYEINLIGPIGMVIFLGLLSYLIVRFQTFNVKLIATQALVWVLVALIGTQFFFIKITVNFILTGVTFIGAIVFGLFLIKSVKKEIKQKEELAKLNIDLQDLLKQRESLVHLVTHKVKGSFTRSKYIFAGLLDGTFGEISDQVKKYAQMGLESDNGGIQTVNLVLNASNLSAGSVKYEMKPVDFKEIVQKVLVDKKIQAEAKGLQMESNIHDDKSDVYNVSGDVFWLTEAVNNLIDNSIKYTKEGKISVDLHDGNGKVNLSVKDTGIGITEEDKKHLFTEGGRGKESVKVNVDSTGYGLYSVKLIIQEHKGKVWAESGGEGKGSAFYIELPADSTPVVSEVAKT